MHLPQNYMQQPTSNHGHPVRVSLFRFITAEGFPRGRCSNRRLDGLQAPKRLGAWRLQRLGRWSEETDIR